MPKDKAYSYNFFQVKATKSSAEQSRTVFWNYDIKANIGLKIKSILTRGYPNISLFAYCTYNVLIQNFVYYSLDQIGHIFKSCLNFLVAC